MCKITLKTKYIQCDLFLLNYLVGMGNQLMNFKISDEHDLYYLKLSIVFSKLYVTFMRIVLIFI